MPHEHPLAAAGYEAGYAKGREAGYAKGYEAGYAKGYEVGCATVYEKGGGSSKRNLIIALFTSAALAGMLYHASTATTTSTAVT